MIALRCTLLAGVLFAIAIPAAALSQSSIPSAEVSGDPNEISVISATPLTLLNRQELADLRKAYLKFAPSLAPQASVKLYPTVPPTAGRRAYVVNEATGESTEFAIEDDGTIALPAIGEDGLRSLQLSSGQGATGVRISVMSSGTRADRRRIGDLRLECQLWWSIARRRSSFLMRAAAGKTGPCGSKKFGYSVRIGKAINSSSVVSPGGAALPVGLSRDKRSAWAPLWNRSIGDDAILELR